MPAGDAGPRADDAFTLFAGDAIVAVAVVAVDASAMGGSAPPTPSERWAARRGDPCGVEVLLLAAEPAGDDRRASNEAAATAAADAEALKDVEEEASDEDASAANEDEGDRVIPDARPCDKAEAEAEGSSENTSSLGESVAITIR